MRLVLTGAFWPYRSAFSIIRLIRGVSQEAEYVSSVRSMSRLRR